MGSALERFRALSRSDNRDNRCQKSPGSDLLAPNAPIVGEIERAEEAEERAAIIEYDSAVPRAWALAYALLLTSECPAWLSVEQWRGYHDAAGRLLAAWAAQMDRLGLSPCEVLGVDAARPDLPWDCSCLLSGLIGVTVGAMSRDRISITFPDGGSRCLERNGDRWVYA